MACEAYQVSDQMTCPCGLSWDMNDPDPPKCRRQRHVEPGVVPTAVRAVMRGQKINATTDYVFVSGHHDTLPPFPAPAAPTTAPVELPIELPVDIAREMAAVTRQHADPVAAMRAAYRVLLDRHP